MQSDRTTTKLAQTFWAVKPTLSVTDNTPSNSMRHHKVYLSRNDKMIVSYSNVGSNPYGVSRYRRILSPALLLKKFDQVRDCLTFTLGLTIAQREAVLRLLTLWAYYGHVYPKAAMVSSAPGCSKATFWRTIQILKQLGLVRVVNRYVIRPHAQISNLYRLDRLVLLLARYLAEHGVRFLESWLKPYFKIPGQQFWGSKVWLQYKFPVHI